MIPVDEEARFINLFCKKGGLDTLGECSSCKATIKGQLISEWLFDVLKISKKTTQKFDEFLP